MTDAKADELIQKAMAYRKQRSELLAKSYGRVKGALGATTAARFVQVEDQLLLLIDLQIVVGEERVTSSRTSTSSRRYSRLISFYP
jgi:tartrate dehydratase beta subunit/fumarate hydratase class I family protein